MPPVKKVTDNFELIETSKFPHAKFPFEKFNPIQSRVFEFYDQDTNAVMSAKTSAGKTAVAEMFLSHELKVRGGKGMYLGPLKALMQQQIDDWTSEDHHFNKYNISICTGDYRLTADRKQELEEANLIIMTSEMLNSRCRNDKSENNLFLREIGTLVVDESHLLTVPGRGDHLEVGLMKFTKINPNARIIFLSATMPNVDEISEWLSYCLTKKDTHLLESKFRPSPLFVYYEKCFDGTGSYDGNEAEKVKYAMSLVEDYPDDKFLIFTHTKRTGELMKKQLNISKIDAEFHHAGLEKSKRIELERRFKSDPKFRCIVATSTLAWGLNLPARRVIILGVHRGLNEVEDYNFTQMVGRAGRVGFDPCGDAYILLPQSQYDYFKKKLQTPQKIISQLLVNDAGHYKVLAFHLVSEIHHGDIRTKEDIYQWFDRSLAHWQAKDTPALNDSIIDSTIDLLKKCGAITEDENGFSVTAIGKISSLFYYSPFDVSDLRKNFYKLFEMGRQDDDFYLSMALGDVDTQRWGIVSRAEREEMGLYLGRMTKLTNAYEPSIKAGYAYYELLNGRNNSVFAAMMNNLKFDFPRLLEVLNSLDSMSAKWGKREWFKTLGMRIRYGVKGELVHLCGIPNIGKVRAEKLWDANIRNLSDVANNPDKVQKVLNLKEDRIKQICDDAKALV